MGIINLVINSFKLQPINVFIFNFTLHDSKHTKLDQKFLRLFSWLETGTRRFLRPGRALKSSRIRSYSGRKI